MCLPRASEPRRADTRAAGIVCLRIACLCRVCTCDYRFVTTITTLRPRLASGQPCVPLARVVTSIATRAFFCAQLQLLPRDRSSGGIDCGRCCSTSSCQGQRAQNWTRRTTQWAATSPIGSRGCRPHSRSTCCRLHVATPRWRCRACTTSGTPRLRRAL